MAHCLPTSLKDVTSCSTNEEHSSKVDAQPPNKSWGKPVKLNLAHLRGGLLLPQSAKKLTQRQLFSKGGDVVKDRVAARKTLAGIPRLGARPTFSVRRTSDTYKAPFAKQKIQVNRSRPSIAQPQNPSNRYGNNIYQWKTQRPIASGSSRNPQNISASSTKKVNTRIPASRLAKIGGKVYDDTFSCQLENSVNLPNVDDIEEKLVKESSLLKSQILKQIHEKTGGVSSCNQGNKQKNPDEQINEQLKCMDEKLKCMDEKLKCMDEKLKCMDEKLDQTLYDLKEILKNLSSDQKNVCTHCSCHCHNTHKICPEANDCAPDTESQTYSLRRSSRLNNKDAQYAYDSLRKSTKFLRTPGSAKKTNTPGRISRKVIAQVNELFAD